MQSHSSYVLANSMTSLETSTIEQKCKTCGKVFTASKVYFEDCNECLRKAEEQLKRHYKLSPPSLLT